jgi:hypothetical protein
MKILPDLAEDQGKVVNPAEAGDKENVCKAVHKNKISINN